MSDSQSIPLSALTSGPSAKFDEFGDSYTGRILSMEERPQTDINTGQVRYFADGVTMRKQWVIVIQQKDGSSVALFARGGNYIAKKGKGESMLAALGTAVRDAGADAVDPGAELTMTYTGTTEAKPGQNPAKLYTAQYTPPVKGSVPTGMFTDE